jgi:hypothetical protein
MKPEEFNFSQYSKSPNLREHLEAIQRHAEAVSRISGNQSPKVTDFKSQPEIQFPPHPKVGTEKSYTTGKCRFVVDPDGNTVINDFPPKIDLKVWNSEIPNFSDGYYSRIYRSPGDIEDHLGLNPKGNKKPPHRDWVAWLVVIVLLLAFCGRQSSDQEQQQPQQNQGFFKYTPTLVKAIA